MEIRLRLFAAFQLLWAWLFVPYYFVVDLLPITYCPRIKNDILKLSISQLAAKIRRGELKSAQVVRAYIDRIKEVNPILNAVSEDRFDDAVKEAEEVDRLIESKFKSVDLMEKDTPLLGVPITVKESCQVEGLVFSVGSLPRKGMKGKTNGAAVQEVKDAGAIILCVTTTPELCLSWETHNLVSGVTNNPYNNHRSSAGSSGGEGALIGAAASPGGVGSDIAGSVRVPSLFNGIFGHKPTPGYVPMDGHYPREPSFDNFLCIGPIVRYAEDLPLMMRALTRYNVEKLRLEVPVDLKKLNVFYQEDAGYSLVTVKTDRDIIAAMRSGIEAFRQLGCKITKTDFAVLADSIELSASKMLEIEGIPDLLASSKTKSKDQLSLYGELLKSVMNLSEFSVAGLIFTVLFERKFFIRPSQMKEYKTQLMQLKSQFQEMLGENGVFFYPTFPVPALHHGESFNKTSGVMYSIIFNALGLPSTHVPMGLGRSNLPIGFQVVAAPHQDRLCFAVARYLEQQFGGWVPPPSCD